MNIFLRKANLDDVEILSALSNATFYETFGKDNTEEDMRLYVETNFSIAKLANDFAEPNAQFFLAFADKEPVAYAKIRTVEEPATMKGRKHIELERIYVKRQFQSFKIGFQLINKCIETAGEQGFEVIWLGVWEHNTKAINFYTRIGFEKFDEHLFQLGKDAQTDHLLKFELK